MPLSVNIAGRVCLCELKGSLTGTEVIGVLSQVRKVKAEEGVDVELLIYFDLAAATALEHPSNAFLCAFPAIVSDCSEVLLVLPGALIRTVSVALRVASNDVCASRSSLRMLEELDDALQWVQAHFPHEVLELRRQRLRSGIWKKRTTRD
ncbi:MAG: hypothetical protein QM784_21870 [Polyangiaceae bacterium]